MNTTSTADQTFPPMPPQDFIKRFIDPAVAKFDKKSRGAKWKWQSFTGLQYLFITATPLLNSFYPKISLSTGLIAALLTFVINNAKFQVHSVLYEVTSESLNEEMMMFNAQAAPYDKPDALQQLATNTKGILNRELTDWAKTVTGAGDTNASRS